MVFRGGDEDEDEDEAEDEDDGDDDGCADEEGGDDEEREVDNAMNHSIASLSTSYGKMASRPSIAIGWILSQMTYPLICSSVEPAGVYVWVLSL